ncbi:MAG TPA: pectin acetylesterase-family hydrolase [Polyangiales bacterium]|nr:pectin acetylesterase-family hydrolase [Polyangiales bacterium]
MRAMKAWRWLVVCGVCLAACGDDGSETASMMNPAQSMAGAAAPAGAGSAAPAQAPADLAAFMATGLNKYLGAAKPAEMQQVGSETRYFFNEADGPVCLRGGRFGMSTRDAGSQDLVIYLQGGGSCTTALCRATETTTAVMPTYGVLNATDTQNPVAGWNVVYSPYCDGSLHFGDSDIPDQNRKHHGLRNLSASLDVAREKFPNPRRILLTGASAGGYATIWATALVRLVYPSSRLFVFNDAGIAISNPASPDGFRSVLGEWGAQQFIPATCEMCKASPHLTPWMSWNLAHDPGITLGMFSSYQDSVISGTFLMLDPAVFKQALLEETAKVVESAPTRAKRFLVEGTQHTVGNIQTTAVNGVSVAQWLGRMLEGDPAWDNVLQ